MSRHNTIDDLGKYEGIHGIIRFYNPLRKYGMIDSDEGKHIFFASGFRNHTTYDEISESIGKNVTFSLTEDKQIENRLIAVDIIFK